MDPTNISGLVIAALGGAAIGVDRQRSGHATGINAHLGGLRTFTLIGGAAGLAGHLSRLGWTTIAIPIIVGLVALVVVSYAAVTRKELDATTEVAALVVVAAGFLSGLGSLALASAVVALTALLLVEKSRLHDLVSRINDEELQATVTFAVMAVVILPLLPTGPVGPLGGIKPRELWLLVLFFSGLSFVGFLARRAVGATHGYPLAGIVAGLISSTNATFTFARLSRSEPTLARSLAVGAIGACTMLFPRVLLAAAILNPSVARYLLGYLAAPFVAGALTSALGLMRLKDRHAAAGPSVNPLQVWPALQMAATFQAVLFGVHWARLLFGDIALMASGAVLGLTDVDALTLSVSRSAGEGVPPSTAARAIAIGILANCGMKLVLALTFGVPEFRRIVGGVLTTMAVLIGLAIAWLA